ncbi:conserved hypothetical protein [Tenacibaculum maritimum]|nr:conserved hypothetical protein [Tenacibaculum maritimum]CAA0222284.1 conserved hypothetical protein [Tenacibaculum maritimum]CAA0223664.1 conserved hypothetical protein [Tenacibaculum maritimum]
MLLSWKEKINTGIMRQPITISILLKLVETANKNNIVLEITSKNVLGNRFRGTSSNKNRIGYAKTGKTFAKRILKKAF